MKDNTILPSSTEVIPSVSDCLAQAPDTHLLSASSLPGRGKKITDPEQWKPGLGPSHCLAEGP